jgi:hypothetical protein
MVIESLIASIVGGALVWVLSEVSHRRRSTEGYRAAIGQVIVDLAEIRLRFSVISVMGELFDKFKDLMPDEEIADAKGIVSLILPPIPDLNQRLDDALRLVAGTDPDLAFRMRNKDQIEPMLTRWQNLVDMHNAPSDARKIRDLFEPKVIADACETLDEAILELAKKHGRTTQRDFKQRVHRWNDRTAQLAEFKKELIEKVPQLAEVFEALDKLPTPLP